MSTRYWQAKKNAVLAKTLKIRHVLPAKRGKSQSPLISDDEEFSLVSSDDEEPLSPSQLMDEKDPPAAEHDEGPSCSFLADEFLNDYNVRPSETDLRVIRIPRKWRNQLQWSQYKLPYESRGH